MNAQLPELPQTGDLSRALQWNVADHQSANGKFLDRRYHALSNDVDNASANALWPYFRVHKQGQATRSVIRDELGRVWNGLNLGSQDYLGLSHDERVQEAAIAAIREWGVHSSGSAPMGGGSELADRVAHMVGAQVGMPHTLLFPTGWAAGYGAIRGLVRPSDYIVIDALAHNCLQHGAHAASGKVVTFIHNSPESLRKRLERIRRAERQAAILIVTESLFSMDSDHPEFPEIIALRDEFEASLLVDVAHDFGVLGVSGAGVLSDNMLYAQVDFLVGSFSKTFASIGGFFCAHSGSAVRAVQGFSGSYTFSNFLIPAQLGAVESALTIAFSGEGDQLRRRVLENSLAVRNALAEAGLASLGRASPIVAVEVGDEATARLSYRALLEAGIIVNCVEYPAVRRGAARFRIQLTPNHQPHELVVASQAIAKITQRLSGATIGRADDIGPFDA